MPCLQADFINYINHLHTKPYLPFDARAQCTFRTKGQVAHIIPFRTTELCFACSLLASQHEEAATDVCAQGHVTVFPSDFLYQVRWSAALSSILAEPCLSLHISANGYKQTMTNTALKRPRSVNMVFLASHVCHLVVPSDHLEKHSSLAVTCPYIMLSKLMGTMEGSQGIVLLFFPRFPIIDVMPPRW